MFVANSMVNDRRVIREAATVAAAGFAVTVHAILQRREQGTHSLAEIWRRHRLSCPDRETLGSFLLGALEADQHRYVEHHVRTLECRVCHANLADLQSRSDDVRESAARQHRYFQSTAGHLK